MPTLPVKPQLLLILILLLSSCAPLISSPQQAPIEQAPQITPALIHQTAAPLPPTQKPPQGKGHDQGQGSNASQTLDFEIPVHPLDVILGRPTSSSITFSLLAYNDQTVSIAYGTEPGNYTATLDTIQLTADTPQTVQLSNLQPDTAYFYAINGGNENTFHTARAPGSAFTFTIQADSHLDSNTDPQIYLQTLANQRTDHPDFVMDLGDTFMTDKYKPYTDAAPQYLAQRYFFGQLADTAPLFLVLGNHDGEGAPKGNAGQDISAWSAGLRTRYFPNPVPDGFYTGNTTPDPTVGALQDYYAWTWGDALFIVLDPYWFTPSVKGNSADLWNPTLGAEQYQWLKTTLEASDARWKFIFIHQLISGKDRNGRGGAEVANFYEWGGQNADGSWGFDQHRPGWATPIHQLLVKNKVSAVFHGHDHLFVTQELDGVIYQECPQPGASRADGTGSAAEYGYTSGEILGGPGHVRVMVSPDQVTVDFVRASLLAQQNGQIAYSYVIEPIGLQR